MLIINTDTEKLEKKIKLFVAIFMPDLFFFYKICCFDKVANQYLAILNGNNYT